VLNYYQHKLKRYYLRIEIPNDLKLVHL